MECLQTNARQRKNFLNGCKLTLGLAVILISIFCVISIDKIYSLTIPVGLLPTITGLRALTDHFAATSVRISNARLNIFSWSISIPLFITEVIINFTSDFKYSETIDEKLEVIITNVLLATSTACILLGIICTYYDIKSSYLPVTKYLCKRGLIINCIYGSLLVTTGSLLIVYLRRFSQSSLFARTIGGSCPFSNKEYGIVCYTYEGVICAVLVLLVSISGLMVYLKLLHCRFEKRTRIIYTIMLGFTMIILLITAIYDAHLIHFVSWSIFSEDEVEVSRWNSVLLLFEYFLVVAVFANVTDLFTKEISIRYFPNESGFFENRLDYPPSFLHHKRFSRPFEPDFYLNQTRSVQTVTVSSGLTVR